MFTVSLWELPGNLSTTAGFQTRMASNTGTQRGKGSENCNWKHQKEGSKISHVKAVKENGKAERESGDQERGGKTDGVKWDCPSL